MTIQHTSRRRLAATMIAAGLAASLFATGCEPAKPDSQLTVGKVDTAILLQDDPDYQSLSIDYMKENTDLRKKFVDQLKSQGQGAKKELQQEYAKQQKMLDGRWMEKTQKFLASRHSSIRDAAQKVAESKNIDMVIIDSKQYPTVESGGVDITPDLALSMSQGGAKPAGTATPGKGG